jgi:hypothetical protein
MQNEGLRTDAHDADLVDQAVLALLVNEDVVLWAIEELVREIGDPLDVDDSLARLRRAGLIHRVGEFVFASRVARLATALAN